MATKKPSSRKSSTVKKKIAQPLTLKNLSENQKQINGRLYSAIDLILDFLDEISGGDHTKLRLSREIIEEIPGFDPPGCGSGPYP